MLSYIDQSARPMFEYLAGYLREPEWDHAIDIVPLVAASPSPSWPLWTESALRDPGLRTHLTRSLSRWSAFRGKEKHDVTSERLLQFLPSLMADLQSIAHSCLCLADVAAAHIEHFAYDVQARLEQFGQEVKKQPSCV